MDFNNLLIFMHAHYSPLYFATAVMALMILLRLMRKEKARQTVQVKETPRPREHLTPEETHVIAGDHPIATQLDLARAYIEMDKKHLAKSILLHVQRQGSDHQKAEAKKLMNSL